jgi:hypothetical protein|tara:strand:+ start:467 stop:1315 length:849 start_codon:yes stop_codon:yes gene_type:complete
MKNILIGLLMMGSLFGQINSVLTLSPTASETTLGNQSLEFRNPARNSLDTLDSKVNVSLTNVKWLGNIVDDMGFNYIEASNKKFDYSLLYFNYGEQQYADETGFVQGKFTPSTLVVGTSWGTSLPKGHIGVTGKVVNHTLHTESINGALIDLGYYLNTKHFEFDAMISNIGLVFTKLNDYEIEAPTSLNLGLSKSFKQGVDIYSQFNLYDGYNTFGQGLSYNIKDIMKLNAGYYSDSTHELTYSSFGFDLNYDRYKFGVGYLLGDETHPLKNTLLLTLNLEI